MVELLGETLKEARKAADRYGVQVFQLMMNDKRRKPEVNMATIDRMIAEIESYLATPMKDAEAFWEQEERRSLHELLEQLKERKSKAE